MSIRVTFHLEATPGINSYWVAVGPTRLTFNSGVAQIDLPRGRTALTWWMRGSEGESISIVAHDRSAREIVRVDKSKIPRGEREGAGSRRVTV